MRDQNPGVADKEQAQRTRSEEILADIKKLRDSYGQDKNRDGKAIPYMQAARLFQKVEKWARDVHISDASQHIEKATEKMDKMITKMEDRWKEVNNNKSYAQVLAGSVASGSQATSTRTQSMTQTEEKRIIVHFPDRTTAETIREQSREDIVERIKGGADAAPANRQVIVVRKLKSGDLAVYVDSVSAKKEMKSTTDWAKRLALEAVIKKRT
jgi:hypothetical protein